MSKLSKTANGSFGIEIGSHSQTVNPYPNYRPEIDGLRALAVIPVVLFHADMAGFSGGFVGVDVFFVISGYLITSILLRDFSAGQFSLYTFYERRARRILPALFVVILACIPLAYAWMLPNQLDEFGASVIAVLTFWSNILFWLQSGYFAEAAELKPLLHTWSLAVEEQYYLLFPILLALAWRWGRRTTSSILLLMALLSFAAAQTRPEWSTFFMTPGRVWELLVGALAAVWLNQRPSLQRPVGELLSVLGMIGLALAVVLFNEATPYPGVFTLVPIVAATAVILSPPGTIVSRILAWSPLVHVGLASYSIYLWHQPIFAFSRLRSLDALNPLQLCALAVLSVGIGFLSYRYVERPFRNRARVSARILWTCAAAGAASFLAAGAYLHLGHGLPQRLESLPGYRAVQTVQPDMSSCTWAPVFEDLPYLTSCEIGKPLSGEAVLIIGDSHSEIYGPALDKAFSVSGITGLYIRNAYCGTLPGIHNDGPTMNLDIAKTCPLVLSRLYDAMENRKVVAVVIANRWTYRLFPTPGRIDSLIFDNGEGGIESAGYVESYVLSAEGLPTYGAEARREAAQHFIDGLDQRFNVPVVLLYPVPEVGWDIAQRNLKALLFDGQVEDKISTSSRRFLERNAFAIDLLDGLTSPNIRRVRPSAILCDTFLPDRCAAQIHGRPLYHDDDHLSFHGVDLVMGQLTEALDF